MIELSGTLKERLDEAIRLARTEVSEEELARFCRAYEKAKIPLLPSAIAFYKRYGGVFREYYLVLSDSRFNRDVSLFCYASHDVEEEALRRLNDAMTDIDSVREVAKQKVCPVGDIGYSYPAVVYVGENGLLYCAYEFKDEIDVYSTTSEILESFLKNNVPVGIDARPVKTSIRKKIHRLQADGFLLELTAAVHQQDLRYPVNTTLWLAVSSDGFSGRCVMDVDARDLAGFSVRLDKLYESLSGSARLDEPYSEGYLEFSADHCGHIKVEGCLYKDNANGYRQKLFFGSEFDQTYLRYFARELRAGFARYAEGNCA
ncbi:MAG: hypothetical protein K6G15_05725 [Desulfovibrio sp.]|nr:hypothetical protein [Desulfovibrio sp.]